MTDTGALAGFDSTTVNVAVPAASLTSSGPLIASVGVPSLSVIEPVPTTGAGFAGVAAASVSVSVGSLIGSFTVGTRTMKPVAPGGTVTVGPAIGAKVRPPSNDTSAGWVSVPSVAVPEAGVSVTVVGVVLGWVSATAKSRLPPSATVGLETLPTCGVSLSLPPGPVPSSRIVPRPVPSTMSAFTAFDSTTV